MQVDGGEFSTTVRCGRSAASGTCGAMPKAVAAKPARPSETVAVKRAGIAGSEASDVRRGVVPGDIQGCQQFQFLRSSALSSVGAALWTAPRLIVVSGAPLESWRSSALRRDSSRRPVGRRRSIPAVGAPFPVTASDVCLYSRAGGTPETSRHRLRPSRLRAIETTQRRTDPRARMARQAGAVGSNRRAAAHQARPGPDRTRHPSRATPSC